MQPLLPPGCRELHGLWPRWMSREPLLSRIPRCIRGQLPRRAAEPRGRKDHVPNAATVEQCSPRGWCQQLPAGRGTGKRDCFLPKKGIREGRKEFKSINHAAAAALWKDQGGGLRRHCAGRGQTPLSSMIQTDWPKFPGFWHCHYHPHHSGKGQEGSHIQHGHGRASAALQTVPAPPRGVCGSHWRDFDPLGFQAADADAFGKAANKAERFLLALQAAKLQQALSSFSCCQAWPGLRLHSESPAPWRLPGEVSPVTLCWQGINNKTQDSDNAVGKEKGPLWRLLSFVQGSKGFSVASRTTCAAPLGSPPAATLVGNA